MPRLRLRSIAFSGLMLFSIWAAGRTRAQQVTPQTYAVEVSAVTQASPPRVQLIWAGDALAGEYDLYRKDPRGTDWGSPIATLSGSATGFADTNVLAFGVYEYQIVKTTTCPPWPGGDPSQWLRGYGYIEAGINAPAVENRGVALLMYESALWRGLPKEIQQLEQDLIGDGWQVIAHGISDTDTVASVKQLITNDYNAAPARAQAVFLLGHIPVPYSGDINPDFHPDHKGAWPADVFYGNMNGPWTDTTVNDTSSDYPWNYNVPGDGNFDQSEIPSPVQLEVGRVDLTNMPSFAPLTEVDLLRKYLNKDHNYRFGLYGAAKRGLIRDNFGVISGDAPATTAWRNFAPFFGAGNILEAGYDEYFSTLAGDSYLWSYAGGGGSFTHADGVGDTSNFVSQDPKCVFFALHGSYFGDWNTTDNFLRAPLGTSFGLASAWTGLPHWFMHPMALGETIGYVTRLTQNNHANGLYKNSINSFAGDVHIALMGDPTLRMHVVLPPTDLQVTAGNGMQLQWNPSPDTILGYYLYRSWSPTGPFQRLTRGFIQGTHFTDAAPLPGPNAYMLRAAKMEVAGSGSYLNLSQGIFATFDPGVPPPPPTLTILSNGDASAIAGTPGDLLIVRTGDLQGDLAAPLQWSGTAAPGVDYENPGAMAALPSGQAQINLMIQPLAATGGGDKTVSATLLPGAGYAVGNPSQASIFLREPAAPTPAVAIRVTNPGQVQLSIEAFPGKDYEIDVSTNLQQWTSLTSGVSGANGQIQYEDAPPSGERERFYRVEVH